MIIASSIQESTLVNPFWPRHRLYIPLLYGQGKPVESVAHRRQPVNCYHTHKNHWPRLLCMHGDGLQLVRIIEGPDKQNPDNQGLFKASS